MSSRFIKYNRTVKGKYRNLKDVAKRRGLELSITVSEYESFVSTAACYYCMKELPHAGYGLDRIDSSIGYTLDNIKACCATCNTAKNNLTESEFYSHIESIYKTCKKRLAKSRKKS